MKSLGPRNGKYPHKSNCVFSREKKTQNKITALIENKIIVKCSIYIA